MSKILSYDNKIYYVKNDSLIQYVSINFNYGSINDKIGGEAHLFEHIVGTYLSQIIKKIMLFVIGMLLQIIKILALHLTF